MISVRIVEELTCASEPSPAAKAVLLACMFRQPLSVKALAREVGMHAQYVAVHCRDLQRLGWMRLVEDGRRLRPEVLVPRDAEARIASEVWRVVDLAPFKGEAVVVCFVEWVVAPFVRLILHARPHFLRNDDTDRNLEYDIFAPEYAWAVEYHGDQHFGPTTRFPGDKAFVDRHKRDLRKIHLSKKNNIRLSIVTSQTLTLEGILETIPKDIPLRAFDPKGPVIHTLEELGRQVAHNQDWDSGQITRASKDVPAASAK